MTHAAEIGRLRAPIPERRGGERCSDDTKTDDDKNGIHCGHEHFEEASLED
jgi:hypothetical protein